MGDVLKARLRSYLEQNKPSQKQTKAEIEEMFKVNKDQKLSNTFSLFSLCWVIAFNIKVEYLKLSGKSEKLTGTFSVIPPFYKPLPKEEDVLQQKLRFERR